MDQSCNDKGTYRHVECAGHDRLGIKTYQSPLQPRGLPQDTHHQGGVRLTSIAQFDAGDDLTGEIIEITRRGLLVALQFQQTTQLLEVLSILTVVVGKNVIGLCRAVEAGLPSGSRPVP